MLFARNWFLQDFHAQDVVWRGQYFIYWQEISREGSGWIRRLSFGFYFLHGFSGTGMCLEKPNRLQNIGLEPQQLSHLWSIFIEWHTVFREHLQWYIIEIIFYKNCLFTKKLSLVPVLFGIPVAVAAFICYDKAWDMQGFVSKKYSWSFFVSDFAGEIPRIHKGLLEGEIMDNNNLFNKAWFV